MKMWEDSFSNYNEKLVVFVIQRKEEDKST